MLTWADLPWTDYYEAVDLQSNNFRRKATLGNVVVYERKNGTYDVFGIDFKQGSYQRDRHGIRLSLVDAAVLVFAILNPDEVSDEHTHTQSSSMGNDNSS